MEKTLALKWKEHERKNSGNCWKNQFRAEGYGKALIRLVNKRARSNAFPVFSRIDPLSNRAWIASAESRRNISGAVV